MPTLKQYTTPAGQEVRETWYTVAECVTEIRGILARAFPAVRFSVRRDRSNNIDVRWMDGPTVATVQPLINHCAGVNFQTIDDSTRTRVTLEADGSRRLNYTQYVECTREYSFVAYETAARRVADRYGVPCCPIAKPADSAPYAEWDSGLLGCPEPQIQGERLTLWVWREVANSAW